MFKETKPQSSCSASFNGECRAGQWIGLHADTGTKLPVWRWSWEVEEATFTLWAFDEPQHSWSDTCAYQDSKNGDWYSISCSLNLTFFCMVHSPQLVLVRRNMTWEEALNYCRHTYTDLASLTSYQENTLAVRKSTAAEVSHVWIGLHFVVRYWIWVDGHALEYKAWSGDEDPKCPARNLRCGALETNNTWTPRDCGEKLNFLCYKNSVPRDLIPLHC
uniref:C-type lectin domain-containing protein n=1 Tax=Astyanax mexicanus TaxID=7994 RepID=W5LRP3_ASTMX